MMDGIILVLRSTSWVKQGPSERSLWTHNIAGHKEIQQRSTSRWGLSRMNSAFIGWTLWKPFSRWVFLLKNWDSFCVLREEGGYHFTTSSHAFQFIPLIRKGEEETIKSEISKFNVAVIFYGTTRLGEALAIVLRYVTADWQIKRALVWLQLLAKSL